jgi:hypothetical protein
MDSLMQGAKRLGTELGYLTNTKNYQSCPLKVASDTYAPTVNRGIEFMESTGNEIKARLHSGMDNIFESVTFTDPEKLELRESQRKGIRGNPYGF